VVTMATIHRWQAPRACTSRGVCLTHPGATASCYPTTTGVAANVACWPPASIDNGYKSQHMHETISLTTPLPGPWHTGKSTARANSGDMTLNESFTSPGQGRAHHAQRVPVRR
jgi:hypothetical protein